MTWGNRGPFCASCGHDRWHHAGFKQPGCTHLGTCRCLEFVLFAEVHDLALASTLRMVDDVLAAYLRRNDA